MLVSRKRLATPYTYRESRPEAREGCTIPIRHGLEILRPLEFWHGLSHYQDYHRQLQTGSDKYHHCRSRVRSGSSEVDITASWAYHLAVLIFLPSYQQLVFGSIASCQFWPNQWWKPCYENEICSDAPMLPSHQSLGQCLSLLEVKVHAFYIHFFKNL